MLSKKLLQFTIAMLLLPALTFAQNTTGSISGSVKADNGEVLVGATISVLQELCIMHKQERLVFLM
jgi:hypothetical protein